MAYITYEQYVALYGDSVPEENFPMYAENASDIIDAVTRYQIEQCGGISALPDFIQKLIQKAAAAQVLYLYQNGLETVMTGQTGQGFTVGKVRVDGASASGSGNKAAQSILSPAALMYLEHTGLIGRCVPCLDQYPFLC